jgi:hypothetical protein
MAQAEEEESSLFLAHASSMLRPKGEASEGEALGSPHTHFTPLLTSLALLHIDEPRTQAFLGDGSDDDKFEGWYLDSSAMHHMTGCVGHLADLDRSVRGSVKFGDESAVEICGIGSIVFVGKTGGHKLLHGVYYILALRNSIISLGQLDEGGSRVEIDRGVLRIWDRHGRLLAKVNHGRNWLYVLHMEVARPLCLDARRDDEALYWHKWFGHLHFEALWKLRLEQMVRGMPQIDHVKQLCDTCVVTNHKRWSFPRQALYYALKQLELVHDVLCGPVTSRH